MNTFKRKIIIHCHMFKNAGSTFDWSLQRSFGNGFVDHRDNINMRRGPTYLGYYLQQHQYIKAISSHHIQLPLPEIPDIQLFPVFIFRHPIDRVESVYLFERNQNAETPGAIHAKKLSFKNYVLWRMEPSSGATIRDFQTRCCAGKPNGKIFDSDFEIAQHTLRTSLIGIVERYDESMVYLEREFQPHFSDINLAYIKQNITKGREKNLQKRIDNIIAELGEEVTDKLYKNNQYDFALYSEVKKVFDKNISCIPDWEDRLNEFSLRCRISLKGDVLTKKN